MTDLRDSYYNKPSPTGFDRLNLAHVLASGASPQLMLIPDILPAGEVGMLVGEPATSKTQLSLTMGIALAAGLPFMGMAIGEPVHVAFFSMEGSRRAIENRLRRIADQVNPGHDPEVTALIAENFHGIYQTGSPGASDSDPMAGIADHVTYMVEAEVIPSLIIIDTLACVSLGDENSTEAARPIWAYANHIREITGGTVMFIHHLGKPGNKQGQAPRSALHAVRGASAHRAAARFILGLTVKKMVRKPSGQGWAQSGAEPGHADLLELRVLENNDGQDGFTMDLERDPETGLLSPQEVLGPEADHGDPGPRRVKLTKDQQVLAVYQDPNVVEADRENLALQLFSNCQDSRSALRSALKRLRDAHLLT